MIKSHRDLEVWKLAMDLAVDCYKLSSTLPNHELYGLGNQLRRASTSIALNIGEGFSRDSAPDYARFLSVARGSAQEVGILLELVVRLEYTDRRSVRQLFKQADRISAMLWSMRSNILASNTQKPRRAK